MTSSDTNLAEASRELQSLSYLAFGEKQLDALSGTAMHNGVVFVLLDVAQVIE